MAVWYQEYLFQRVIPMPHETYIDQDGRFIQYMIRIHEITERVERKREQKLWEARQKASNG